MMKHKLFLFVLLINLSVSAQVRFTVFKNYGNVQFFSSKLKNWQILKARDTIYSQTKIKNSTGATLIVFDSLYRIYELKQQGEFLVKNVIGSAGKPTSTEMQKAVKFFVQQTFAKGNSGNSQKAKGAVYRGEESVFPWDGTVILNDSFDVMINLARTSYPIKITLHSFSLMAYGDTVLRLSTTLLKENENNILKIGTKKQIQLSKEVQNRDLILSYIASLSDQNNKAEAVNYALVIMHCINASYYDSARLLVDKIRVDAVLFQEVKDLLKDNATAVLLMRP